MVETRPHDPVAFTIVAPSALTAATRSEMRAQLLELLERATQGSASAIAVDLRDTHEIDASGLGVLVLIQKRARERGLSTNLMYASEPVRRLLVLTRLDYLFDLHP